MLELELGEGEEFSILEVLEHIEQANRGYQGLKLTSGTFDRVSTWLGHYVLKLLFGLA